MQGLILETSCQEACLLLTQEGKVIKALLLDGGPSLSKELGAKVKKILGTSSVDFVAVGTGPGSYTGVRVGVAMAKALAFGWKIPLLGFCSLEAFLPPAQGPFSILLDAKSTGVYCLQGRRNEEVLFEKPRLLSSCPDGPLFSPQSEQLTERFQTKVDYSPLNVPFLAALCSKRAPLAGQSASAPFPLEYLTPSR